jgi:hypothetical protein
MKALKDIQGPQVSQPNLRNISNSPNSEGRDLSGILVSMRAEVDPTFKCCENHRRRENRCCFKGYGIKTL